MKIYTSNALAYLEYSSYQAAKHSFIVPLIYEKGPNYIIMEYLLGPALDNYLQTKRVLPKWVTTEILYLLKKMKQFHFSRIVFGLRHVFIDKNKKFKIIDLVHAYTIEEPVPSLLISELRQLGLLQTFLQQAQELDPLLYFEWKRFFLF